MKFYILNTRFSFHNHIRWKMMRPLLNVPTFVLQIILPLWALIDHLVNLSIFPNNEYICSKKFNAHATTKEISTVRREFIKGIKNYLSEAIIEAKMKKRWSRGNDVLKILFYVNFLPPMCEQTQIRRTEVLFECVRVQQSFHFGRIMFDSVIFIS